MKRNNKPGTALAITLCAAAVAATTLWLGACGSLPEALPGPSPEPSTSQPDPVGQDDSEPAEQPSDATTDSQPGRGDDSRSREAPGSPNQAPAGTGETDGALPDGTTVFDSQHPGVTNLNPDFLQALRDAAAAAEKNGVVFYVASGWRSPAYQEQLLQDAITEYGSRAEASKWVAPPNKSLHVSGDAVDIDGSTAQTWLAEHGASHGLCPVYENEPWHYEFRPEAKDQDCPAMYADAAHDPRLK